MNQILSLMFALVLLSLNLIPFFLVLGALFPSRLARSKEVAARMPGRAFVIGMVNFLFFVLIALALFTLAESLHGFFRGVLLIPALLLTILLAIALGFGLGSMAHLLGERLAPAGAAWKQVAAGTLALGLGCALPLLGWFLLLPYAAWVGMGAFIIGLFQKPAL